MTVTEYSRIFDVNGRLQSTTVTRDGRVISYRGNRLQHRDPHHRRTRHFANRNHRFPRTPSFPCARWRHHGPKILPASTTTTTRSASGLPNRTTTTVINLLGETVSSTDEFGTVTTYAHDHANRTDTETRNEIYTTHTRFCDGRKKSTNRRNAIIPTSFTYQVDGDAGFITTTTSIGTLRQPPPGG